MLDYTYPYQISNHPLQSKPIFHGVRLLAHTTDDAEMPHVTILHGPPDARQGWVVANEPPAPEHWLYEHYGYEAIYDHPLTYAQIVGLAQAGQRSQAAADRHNRERAAQRSEG
jgi:hypothetical protein